MLPKSHIDINRIHWRLVIPLRARGRTTTCRSWTKLRRTYLTEAAQQEIIPEEFLTRHTLATSEAKLRQAGVLLVLAWHSRYGTGKLSGHTSGRQHDGMACTKAALNATSRHGLVL